MIRWPSCVFAILAIASIQVSAAPNVEVDITPKGQTTVKVGSSLKIVCRTGSPLMLCRVEIPGERSMILSPSQEADGIEYFGVGLERGECGAYISKVEERHNGTFKCFVVPTNDRRESEAKLNIIIAKPPEKPELIISPYSTRNRNSYKKGERMEVSCRARGGQPPANLSIYFGDEMLKPDDNSVHYTPMYDNHQAILNVSRELDWMDNGKTLLCRATHVALDRPKEDSTEIEVRFPPIPQATIQQFGLIVGQRGNINVTIFANPRPEFLWRIGGEVIRLGRTDESGRLQTSTEQNLGRGAWNVILTIDNVEKSDTEKEYILEARNNEGAYEYRIVLSTSAQPAGVDLDAGSIIGIVIGVLALIMAVFLVIFARATGRWCFAGQNLLRATGESSDTESAGRYSKTEVDNPQEKKKSNNQFFHIFKNKKDKVSGTGTDTVRTIVTIDDDKLKAEPEEMKSAQSLSQSGIVYAELDLTLQQPKLNTSRPTNEDKTEYAEILYTKPEPVNSAK